MKKNIISFCLLALLALSASVLKAAPLGFDNARSLGMGGVSVAIADDYQALYRNPAGISMQKKTHYSLLTPTFSRNSDYSHVLDSIDSLSDSDSAATRYLNYKHLESVMGKNGYQSWSESAYYISEKGFGISLKYDDYQRYSVENPTIPRINSSVYKDLVFSGTYSQALDENKKHNIFRDKATGWWGATVKIASRKMTESTYWARDFSALTPSLVKDTDKSGMALDLDFGALWQLSNPMKTTIGVFVGNVLESKFSEEAGRYKRQYSLGVSIKPLTGEVKRNEKLTLAAEYFDDGLHSAFLSNIRLGAQIEMTKGLRFLCGIKGGYLTAGMDFNYKDLTFGASTYSEELGKKPGDREDRCYAVDASLRF